MANGLNQGKQADATVYSFDGNGNLTSDGWFTFTYDLENKLLSALPINAGVRTLSYDPLNRLDVYNPGTAKRFIYDGDEVIAELNASGNIVGRYVRGDAPDEIITGYTSSDPTARGWYHLDNRNSVIAVTDPNGVVTVLNRYDEYGQPQGGNYGTFQYTGQMWLGEIGVYNYKNRMYWPNERPGGRFLQTDPIGSVDSPNPYQYVLNDPVNFVDPLGLQSETRCVQVEGGKEYCSNQPFGSGFAGSGTGSWGAGTGFDVAAFFAQLDAALDETIEVVGRRIHRRAIGLWSDFAKGLQSQTCSTLSLLGDNGRLRFGGDIQSYGGIGGAAGAGIFIDSHGRIGTDRYYGWGAGLGLVGGVGLSIGNDRPQAGNIRINHLQGGVGGGWIGAQGTYSSWEGASGSGGVGVGPKLGYSAGSVTGRQIAWYGGSICE